MKKQSLVLILWLILATVTITSCSSGDRIGGTSKKCGCGMNKGMVGY
jgi:hypothetical protein